jgi:hypothetical protein
MNTHEGSPRLDRRQALRLGVGLGVGAAVELVTGGCIVEPIEKPPTVGPEVSPTNESLLADPTATELVTNTPTRIVTPRPSNTTKPTSTQEPTQTQEPTATRNPESGGPFEMADLQNRLAARIEGYRDFQGRTAISVTDATTLQTINVNGGRPQLTGCVANLPLMLSVVNELSQKRAAYSQNDFERHLIAMVRNSDPHEGKTVVSMLGGDDIGRGIEIVNRNMNSWGMARSLYNHPPAYPDEYTEVEASNQIVANELNAVLAKLAQNKLFGNVDMNEYAKFIMSNNKPGLNFMIPGNISDRADVVHKVGWFYGFPNTINDAGIVKDRRGRFSYSIVTMFEDFNDNISENALFVGPGSFLAGLSEMVYSTFDKKYS